MKSNSNLLVIKFKTQLNKTMINYYSKNKINNNKKKYNNQNLKIKIYKNN